MAKRESNRNQNGSEGNSSKGGFWANLNPLRSLQEAGRVVRDGIGNAPREQVGFIVISFLALVIAIVVSLALIREEEYVLGGVLASIALAPLLFGMWCISRMSKVPSEPKLSRQAKEGSTENWLRVTVKARIGQIMPQELALQVRAIRDRAQTRYSALLRKRKSPPSQMDPDRVRVNVFLPDTGDVGEGEVCALFIPPDLHTGMRNEDERGMTFRPNQGVTGRVFTRQEPIGTRRTSATEEWEWIYLEGNPGLGDRKFQLTQSQMRQIDENLRWIVSFPLTVTIAGKQETVGVLNIDGLSEVLTPEEMQTIYSTQKPEVARFSERLAELEKCKITITVEDVADETTEPTG